MSNTLPKPKARTLYLPEQVNQESMNKLTKAIIDINKSDDYLKKLYAINDIDYVPTKKHILFGHHYTSIAGAAPIIAKRYDFNVLFNVAINIIPDFFKNFVL